MKIILIISGLLMELFLMELCGCGTLLTKAFSVESPRPNKEQIVGAKEVNQINVPIIAKLQEDKQARLEAIGLKGIELLPQCKTPEQIEALTNIVANVSKAIKDADGTAKILGAFGSKTVDDILNMPFGEYMAYAGVQGMLVAPQAREYAFEGIKAGFQWSMPKILGLAGGTLGGGGVIYTLLRTLLLNRRRKNLLVETAKVVEKENNPELKAKIAKATATIPLNVSKEFGLS